MRRYIHNTCTCLHICVHVRTCVYVHIFTIIYIFLCMYVHTFIHVYTYELTVLRIHVSHIGWYVWYLFHKIPPPSPVCLYCPMRKGQSLVPKTRCWLHFLLYRIWCGFQYRKGSDTPAWCAQTWLEHLAAHPHKVTHLLNIQIYAADCFGNPQGSYISPWLLLRAKNILHVYVCICWPE